MSDTTAGSGTTADSLTSVLQQQASAAAPAAACFRRVLLLAARAAAAPFTLLVLGAAVLAVTQPAAFSWVNLIDSGEWRRAVSTTLFGLAFGVASLHKELKGLMTAPLPMVLSFALQWTILPVLAFAVLRLARMPLVAATGVCVPCAIVLLARACYLLQARASAQARAV